MIEKNFIDQQKDIKWMKHALQLAERAEAEGEVPVGAVLVLNNEIIGEGWNQPILSCDPTAHAEIVALRTAAKKINNYRLINSTLYVTLEPCLMCLGAMIHARIKRLVYGATDLNVGAINKVLVTTTDLNHSIEHNGGVLAEHCAMLLKNFFKNKR